MALWPKNLMNFCGWLSEKFVCTELVYQYGKLPVNNGEEPNVSSVYLRVEPISLDFWFKIYGDAAVPQHILDYKIDSEFGIGVFNLDIRYFKDTGVYAFAEVVSHQYGIKTRHTYTPKFSLQHISMHLTVPTVQK